MKKAYSTSSLWTSTCLAWTASEAAKAIRRNEASLSRAHTPIIALTADALETGRRACREAGMDGFLTKPVEPTQLGRYVRRFLPLESSARNVAA